MANQTFLLVSFVFLAFSAVYALPSSDVETTDIVEPSLEPVEDVASPTEPSEGSEEVAEPSEPSKMPDIKFPNAEQMKAGFNKYFWTFLFACICISVGIALLNNFHICDKIPMGKTGQEV